MQQVKAERTKLPQVAWVRRVWRLLNGREKARSEGTLYHFVFNMATYTDRMKGIKEVTYEEAFQNVKDDLRYQLIWVYFKDEPEFVKIIEDDDAYERIFGKF